MKYYFIDQIPEDIGQVEETDNKNYDCWASYGYTHIPLEGKVPPGIYLPPCFLAERSKPTDFINVVQFGYKFLVVTPKVLEVLGSLDIDYHSVLDTKVIIKDQNINYLYHAIHFPWFRNELYIDWENTVFTVKEKGFFPIGEIQFENYIEYRQWHIENIHAKTPKLRDLFLNTHNLNKDLFILNDILRIYIASERLKSEFEEHNITGVGFRQVAG